MCVQTSHLCARFRETRRHAHTCGRLARTLTRQGMQGVDRVRVYDIWVHDIMRRLDVDHLPRPGRGERQRGNRSGPPGRRDRNAVRIVPRRMWYLSYYGMTILVCEGEILRLLGAWSDGTLTAVALWVGAAFRPGAQMASCLVAQRITARRMSRPPSGLGLRTGPCGVDLNETSWCLMRDPATTWDRDTPFSVQE